MWKAPCAHLLGLLDQILELGLLVSRVLELCNGAQRALGDCGPADHVGERENVLLDLRSEAEQTHDLGHAGAGDAFPTDNCRLGGNIAGVELPPLLLGLS